MSVKRFITLPAEEWDFRQVDDASLPTATFWEYARESKVMRQKAEKWLESSWDGSTAREILTATCCLGPAEQPNKLILAGMEAIVNLKLCYLVVDHPQFPLPWLKLGVRCEKNPKFSRVMMTPMEWEFVHNLELLENMGVDGYKERLAMFRDRWSKHRNEFHLRIDWSGASVKEILADVERKIRKEAKKHPELIRGGKPAQAHTDKLKCLAAYRLKHAERLTFEDAQRLLGKVSDGGRLIPIFADKPSWTRAIARAAKELKRFDTGSGEV